ncbi:hypothetical protein M0R45_014763 [Rubus argutus]|uniref:Protein kinase domain-containing protein n=1 Tax=Rubus argutus TaxID=59490 RepID=A0AAW1XMP0_RUBAR
MEAVHIRSQKLDFLLLILLSFLLAPYATPLTFDFPSFSADDIFVEGDATIDAQFISLTKSSAEQVQNGRSVGRATYSKPFLVREPIDFTTDFVFTINPASQKSYGDGLAFFIAANGSLLEGTVGSASSLGLPVDDQHPFVAVKFDINSSGYSVGIGINSDESSKLVTMPGVTVEGQQNSASVSYDSGTQRLSASVTTTYGESGSSHAEGNLYKTVNMEYYFPADRVILVGFSASTGSSAFAQHKITSWKFTSTSLQNAAALVPASTPVKKNDSVVTSGQTSNNESQVVLPAPGPSSKAESTKHRIPPTVVIVSITIGGIILLGLFVWFMLRIRKSKIKESIAEQPIERISISIAEQPIGHSNDVQFEGIGPRKFSYNELAWATSDFDKGKKLGEGGFGEVYRGRIDDDLNPDVAVKRISPESRQGRTEYEAEVKIISKLQHRHLVQLIGWCHENEKFLLVYKFIPNGSLDTHLFKETPLIWEVRYRIVKELALVI